MDFSFSFSFAFVFMMAVRLVNQVTMSSIQKSKNEDIDEAIAILEEESNIQQRTASINCMYSISLS